MKYKKRPIVVEAFQMTRRRGASNEDWPEWLNRASEIDRGAPGSIYRTEAGDTDSTFSLETLEGEYVVSWDDWIIQGERGELYPRKPDIFEATYGEAEGEDE